MAATVFKKSLNLNDVAIVVQGCKPFQVGKGVPAQTREIVISQRFVASSKENESFRPLLRGSLINRYQIYWADDYWISFGEWLAEPRASANFDADEKICVRQTGDGLIATLDNSQFIARDNLYVVHTKTTNTAENYALLYLLALLNSRSLNLAYRLINPEIGEVLAQVKREHLLLLPIRRIEFTTAAEQRNESLERARALYAAGDFADLLDFVGQALDATPARSDVVHDVLAWLAGEMMRLHAEKNAEVGGFLEWLESFIGARVAELANKNRVRGYADEEFEAFLAVLTQNRARLAVVPSAREQRKQLLDEWTSSRDKLKPLQTQIARTDDLIDAIVYRLYGLSDDEIALVKNEPDDATAEADDLTD